MPYQRTPEDEAEYKAYERSFGDDYMGKENKQAFWDAKEKNYNTQQGFGSYVNAPGAGIQLGGTAEEQSEQVRNLSQVGAMTGQNLFQTGQQQQDYYNSLQSRRNGDDAVAANMMAGRNRNVANVARQFAGKGVAGGVAAAGMNTATNTADSEINAQKQKNARTNDQDLWNYVKKNQKVTGEALAAGQDAGLAQGMDTSQAEGAFGTVICTELHRQGIMDDETYRKDVAFGIALEKTNPFAIYGYRMLATPVVNLMRKSKLTTKVVSFFAMAWADHMAGRENRLGSVIMTSGLIFCGFVGFVAYIEPRKVGQNV